MQGRRNSIANTLELRLPCTNQFIWYNIHLHYNADHIALQWRHSGRDSVSNHQPHDCFPNPLFRRIKHQSSASLAFVRGIHRGPVNSPHKWPVMRKLFPFDDVIMDLSAYSICIVILDLTPGFNFWELVHLIWEVLQYVYFCHIDNWLFLKLKRRPKS